MAAVEAQPQQSREHWLYRIPGQPYLQRLGAAAADTAEAIGKAIKPARRMVARFSADRISNTGKVLDVKKRRIASHLDQKRRWQQDVWRAYEAADREIRASGHRRPNPIYRGFAHAIVGNPERALKRDRFHMETRQHQMSHDFGIEVMRRLGIHSPNPLRGYLTKLENHRVLQFIISATKRFDFGEDVAFLISDWLDGKRARRLVFDFASAILDRKYHTPAADVGSLDPALNRRDRIEEIGTFRILKEAVLDETSPLFQDSKTRVLAAKIIFQNDHPLHRLYDKQTKLPEETALQLEAINSGIATARQTIQDKTQTRNSLTYSLLHPIKSVKNFLKKRELKTEIGEQRAKIAQFEQEKPQIDELNQIFDAAKAILAQNVKPPVQRRHNDPIDPVLILASRP